MIAGFALAVSAACTRAESNAETAEATDVETELTADPEPVDPEAGRTKPRTPDPDPDPIAPQIPATDLPCEPFTWHEGSTPKEIVGSGGGYGRGYGARARRRHSMAKSAPDVTGAAEGGIAGDPALSSSDSRASAATPAPAAESTRATSRPEHAPRRIAPRVPERRAGLLTAGEWRDLDHWSFYKKLFRKRGENDPGFRSMEKQWGFGLRQRVSVTVTTGSTPAPNVSVYLKDAEGKNAWLARTDNTGVAHLYPHWYEGPYTVCAAVEGAAGQRQDIVLEDGLAEVQIGLDAAAAPKTDSIDVMFMVDTTGSMGDELSYLQSELQNVISRVQDKNPNAEVRTSVNFYRDTTDEYIVRPFAFTRSVRKAKQQIAQQSAGGGGDFPEAVDQALHSAIYQHEWSETARARILFLVLDAPPHQDKEILSKVRRAARRASKQGIRIVPVAGSGIDKPTEFLMRFLAIATGGTYVFLTDDSGIGHSHLKPTVGQHQVHKLNSLLETIINRYAE